MALITVAEEDMALHRTAPLLLLLPVLFITQLLWTPICEGDEFLDLNPEFMGESRIIQPIQKARPRELSCFCNARHRQAVNGSMVSWDG